MSVHEGKQIVSALEAFNANRILRSDVTSLLTVALRGNGILPRHLDMLEKMLEREIARIPANIGVTRAPEKEGTNFISYAHMDIQQDPNGETLYDRYTPRLVSYVTRRKKFLRHETLLPVSFNAQHTAFRFIQRTSKVLDYKSDEFFDSIMCSSVMMQAMTHSGDGPPRKPIPMFLYHKEGLFLGYAESMPDDIYRRQFDHVYRRGKRVLNEHVIARDPYQPYVPTMRAVVKTFVPASDMTKDKSKIWHDLRALLKNPQNYKIISEIFRGFMMEVPAFNKEQTESATQFFDALTKTMDTPAWANLSRSVISNGHIPEIGFREKLFSTQVSNTAPKATFG